ncbi:hypothetical protein KVV02_008555 [Mortierella alpina]|uniref:Copper-fist domain-containing protein n=1 Tax=Mortierella alpina TaxID=64518 RepID=A0A9P8A679_MORAP|nr:hypothetical protein KVV02_008555 [Mortierella alpina]
MVFLNGQKFACATCIKGHRSTTCNHGYPYFYIGIVSERPLHEIKKKGRPSTQCPHCKELRKAKQVHVRCICGREEGSAAVVNGLKRAKSLSHDGRLPVSNAVGGEDLLRSLSSQGQSPQDSLDARSSTGGHIVVKPGKGSAHAGSNVFKSYQANRQRSGASLDLGKSGILHFPRESGSPLPFVPHTNGGQTVPSADGQLAHGLNGAGMHTGIASPLLVQTLSPSGSSACDHSPSSSSMGSHQSQMQSNLCFDYASSSDYDSDHYNPTTSYSYFPDALTSYPVSNASDDMEDMDMMNAVDSKKIMDGIMNGTTTLNPMESASADEIRMLYSALSSFSTTSPPLVPTPPSRSYSSPGLSSNPSFSSASSANTGCCGSGKSRGTASSPASSIPSHSPPAGRSEIGEDDLPVKMDGCGCAISPNMCCCGERCACPGCLAYPNNQNLLNGSLEMDLQSNGGASTQAASCCGSNKANVALVNDVPLLNNSSNVGTAQTLNLSTALSLVQADSSTVDFSARQALKQEFKGMGLAGLDSAKMQHPTLLGNNGVLICGCGCGRPTVDCAECYRDMCQFVGESQARMMKDDLDFESALNGAAGRNGADLGPNMNLAMSMGMSMDMNMDMNVTMTNLGTSGFGQTQPIVQTMPQTMSLMSMQNQRSDASSTMSPSYDQQQQQQQPQQQQQSFARLGQETQGQDAMMKLQQQQQQLAQQMEQRLSLRRRFREGMEEEQKLQLQLMEQERMQLQQLQQSMPSLSQLQLDFLDNEDWSFVDEIRTDATDMTLNEMQKS